MAVQDAQKFLMVLTTFVYLASHEPSRGEEITIEGTCTVGNFGCQPEASVTFSVSNGVASGQFWTSSALIGVGCGGTNICNSTFEPTVNGGFFVLPKCNKSLRATFTCGGTTTPDCNSTCTVDPVFTTLEINTGRTVVQSFDEIPKSEHLINVTNGEPGLKFVSIRINSKDFKRLKLDDSVSGLNVDAASAMTDEKNTITFIGRGEPGAFANIVVGDASSPTRGSVANAVVGKAQKFGIWGPLVDSAEDNAIEEVAIVAKQQIQLSLAASLDLSSASTASHYSLAVNGVPIANLQVGASSRPDGTVLLLRLPTRSFKLGDAIQVNWNGLKNSKGQLLSGQVDLVGQ